MATEYWKPVAGYEDLYEVSDLGRVKGPKGIVKPKPTNNGYVRTELWCKGVRERPSIHRLVAKIFVPNPENKPQVNHIDGDRLNNAAANLEWCTAQENSIHAVHLRQKWGTNVATAKLTDNDVIAIRVLSAKGIPGTWIAKTFGITNAQVSHIVLRQHWARN